MNTSKRNNQYYNHLNVSKKIKVSKSYGIACCKKNKLTNEYEILLIKKKASYAYITFCKGIYVNNYDIIQLFNKMTLNEKLIILSYDFKLIWYHCFLSYDETDKRLIKSKKKFDKYIKNNSKYIYNIISESKNVELIWEIPKGHVNKNEENINAAIREFYEETHINKSKYKILYDVKPLIYSFTDENIHYIYYYYIAVMIDHKFIPKVSYKSSHMLFETSDIKFLPINSLFSINREYKFINLVKKIIKFAKPYILK